MRKFDLAIAYTWEYDEEFVHMLEKTFHKAGRKTYVIHKGNVHEVEHQIKNDKIYFKALFDRASDEDDDFYNIHELLKKKKAYIFNPHFKTDKAVDKSYMHEKLQKAGLPVPNTIIVPPYDKAPDFSIDERMLNFVGRPFVIKPSYYSGGSNGVVMDCYTADQIFESRKIHTDDSYLIQQKIAPLYLKDRRAWFRCFWLINIPVPTWWNDQTHIYKEINVIEYEEYELYLLNTIVKKIARISKLDYFSCEIAINHHNEFVIIDYLNDQCDLRFQSKHTDGVPDIIAKELAKRILQKVTNLQ